MPTRNVVLTGHQAELIERLIASGRYQNASEVLREGLRLIESRDVDEQARLRALREAARVGLADFDAGRYVTFDNASDLREHLSKLTDDVIAAQRK
jgi:antitoxin ParD1/3/4